MKLEVTFYDNSQISFPEVNGDTITMDNGLMAFKFRNGHVATLVLRSIKFMETMPDDEITEQSVPDIARMAEEIAEISTPLSKEE